jgi:CDP-glucose 4,6-dehydratase
MNPEFWRSRKVFLTGHTGFKAGWLSLWLQSLGAEVTGYSLAPPTHPNLFELARVSEGMESVSGDVRDLEHLQRVLRERQPEVVFHLAAQPVLRLSYVEAVRTFSTNVLGTVHILESAREVSSVRSMVIITSDKCYENLEDQRAYGETDRLGGADPYSASKAAAELVVAAYRKSFFDAGKCAGTSTTGVASARAGNVIGGGDWAADRLVPDVMRAALGGRQLSIRNPNATRPWQHVLNPLSGYLTLAEKLYESPNRFAESWNFGPEASDCVPVLTVLNRLRELWGPGLSWQLDAGPHPHEDTYLKLDCSKAKALLGWEPAWDLDRGLEATAQWYKAHQSHEDLRSITLEQIRVFQSWERSPEVLAR